MNLGSGRRFVCTLALRKDTRITLEDSSCTASRSKSSTMTCGWIMSFSSPHPTFYTGRKRDFEVDLDTCWYGRVVLLFRIKVRSDSGQIWECDCAMIDVLFYLKPARCKGIT